MIVDGRPIPLIVEETESEGDWAILKLASHDLRFVERPFGYIEVGRKALIETSERSIVGEVDAVDVTMGLKSQSPGRYIYEDLFEIAVNADIKPGISGALVVDKANKPLGIVVGSILDNRGRISVIAQDARRILKRYGLSPALVASSTNKPHIGILLENDMAADAIFSMLNSIDRYKQSGRMYFSGTTDSGIKVTCSILRKMGAGSSAIAMTAMLIDNKLDAAFILTECVGLRPDQNIGDLLVATEVFSFEKNHSGDDFFQSGSQVYVPARFLSDSLRYFSETISENVNYGAIASISSIGKKDIGLLNERVFALGAVDNGLAGALEATSVISREFPTIVIGMITDLADGKKRVRDVSYKKFVRLLFKMLSRLEVTEVHGRRYLDRF